MSARGPGAAGERVSAGAPLALVLDGERIDPARAAFLPLERGLLYGDGLFETLPVLGARALGEREHFARLVASCAALGLPAPARARWEGALAACLAWAPRGVGSEARAALRVTWTRGPARARGYAPGPEDGPPRLMAALFAIPPADQARWSEGLTAVTVRGLAPGDLARHKTLSAMPYVVAQARARAEGADEALLVDAQGRVLEAAGSNLFFRFGDRAVTPGRGLTILPGIARARVMEWSPQVEEADLPVERAHSADEAFLTNAVRGVTPLRSCDGRAIGDGREGDWTRRMRERYRAWIVEEAERGA